MMRDVKFYFFKLEYKLAKGLLNFSLKEYFKNPLNLKDHLVSINNHKGFLERKKDNIFSFQKFRKDFNPTIKDEQTGQTRSVNLKETESFIEEVFLYWDFDHDIVIFQRNYAGFGNVAFEKYILKLLNDKFENDFFTLKPIMSKDGIEKLIKHNVIKSIDVSVPSPSIEVLNNLGFDANKIKKIDQDSIDRIEIKITSKRKTGIFNLDDLKKLLDFSKNKDKYKRLKLKASGSYASTGEIVDLLDDFYVVNEKINTNSKAKTIDISDIIIKLGDIYEKHLKEVLKLI